MQSKEEFNKSIDEVKSSVDEQSGAILSEPLLAIKASYANLYDEKEVLQADYEKLKKDNEELLKTNGRLFQKLGTNEPIKIQETEKETSETEESKIVISDIFDEKGNFKR